MGKEEDDDDVSSVDMSEHEEAEEEDEEAANDLSNADIVTKYRTAGDIANRVLLQLVPKILPGATAVSLCCEGDKLVEEATAKVYNQKKGGKKVEKGTAFPTCISVNHCVGHYSPLTSEDKVVLAEGDVVKIDLGVHVDGYIAVVAHTTVCSAASSSATGPTPATGRKADVMQAAWHAAELAQRMFKEGASNVEITEMIAKVFVFSIHRTHFSHMSHPTFFPISHMFILFFKGGRRVQVRPHRRRPLTPDEEARD